VEEALPLLEQAVDLEPRQAAYWNDLAVAWLELASRRRDEDATRRALEAANRALGFAPTQPEALFNRALALERLRKTGQAADAWSAYLAVDPSSPWSSVAREHLARAAPQ
jgi:tetratricopeptide (TPR) repeat protein